MFYLVDTETIRESECSDSSSSSFEPPRSHQNVEVTKFSSKKMIQNEKLENNRGRKSVSEKSIGSSNIMYLKFRCN